MLFRSAAVDYTAASTENFRQIIVKIPRQLTELRKDQHALTLFRNRLRQLPQHFKLAVLRRAVFLGAEILVWMVANLL